jgi:hypothetical protein
MPGGQVQHKGDAGLIEKPRIARPNANVSLTWIKPPQSARARIHPMPITVSTIAGGKVLLWHHTGRITIDDVLPAITEAAVRYRNLAGVHDLVVYEPGAYADLSADDLRRTVDAVADAFSARYVGDVKCAIVVGRLNYGIARQFCSLLEQEQRIVTPAFVFVNCRHALEWLGLRNDEIDRALVEVGILVARRVA